MITFTISSNQQKNKPKQKLHTSKKGNRLLRLDTIANLDCMSLMLCVENTMSINAIFRVRRSPKRPAIDCTLTVSRIFGVTALKGRNAHLVSAGCITNHFSNTVAIDSRVG